MKDELKSRFKIFVDILDLIETSQNEDGISNISQKELSSRLSISPTNVSYRLKILAKYNAIVKEAPGANY
ncbi:ArsR family transcriptional regulator [Vibrio vulnificus]|nr:ArsR family transcriptional regulator [Vibrio vulnificus]